MKRFNLFSLMNWSRANVASGAKTLLLALTLLCGVSNAWGEEYVLANQGTTSIELMDGWSQATDKSYTLSGPGHLLTFEVEKGSGVATGSITVTAGTTTVKTIRSGDLDKKNVWYGYSVDLTTFDNYKTNRSITFSAGGTLSKYLRSAQVTMAQYIDDPSTTSLDFGTANLNATATSNTFTVAWCNVPAMSWSISGAGASQFSVSADVNAEAGKYNTTTFTVTYKHDKVGAHNATLTITDSYNGYSKTVSLSGSTYTTYYAAAYAKADQSVGGGVWISLNGNWPSSDANYIADDSSTKNIENQTSSPTINANFDAKAKTGYTFKGWFTSTSCGGTKTSSDAKYVEKLLVTSINSSQRTSITRYAYFTANTYTIAFNGNGATSGSTASVSATYDQNATLTSNGFSRTGYTFVGWNTNADGSGTSYGNSATVKNLTSTNGATVTLYAQWKSNNTNVTLDPQGGSGGTTSVTVAFGADMPSATMPQQMGYTFAGYYDATTGGKQYYNADGSSACKWDKAVDAATLYAHWTPITYYVTFDGNGNTGGTAMSQQTYTFGEKYTLPANTYEKKYVVTFNANGGSCTPSSSTSTATFMGWEDRGSITYNGKAYNYTEFDAPYYANTYSDLYIAFGYNKFDLVGHYIYHGKGEPRNPTDPAGNPGLYPDQATNVASLSTEQGTTTPLVAHWGETPSITLPTPTRAQSVFDGWYDAATGGTKIGDAGATYTPSGTTGAITLYAHWTINNFSITYKDKGGAAFSGTHESGYPTIHTYGTATPLKSASKVGYGFGGWYTTSDCSGSAVTSLGATDYTADITLYAKWNPITISNAEAKTVNFTAQTQTQTADLIFNVANASSNNDFNTPTIAGDGWTIKSWNYANNQVTVTVSYTAIENTTTRGNHKSTVTLTANSGNSATGQVTAYVDMTPVYTNTLASSYTQGTAAIDLSTAWTSSSNGAITYSVQSVTPGIQINGTTLILGDAGTATLTLTQAAGTSSKASSDTKTITVTKPANHLEMNITSQTAYNNYKTAATDVSWTSNGVEFAEKNVRTMNDVRTIVFTFTGVPDKLSFTTASKASFLNDPKWTWSWSANGQSWTQIGTQTLKAITVNTPLDPSARAIKIEYTGVENIGYTSDIKVTERSGVEASDMEFKRYYNEGPAEQTQKINWYNELPMTLSIEGTDADKFTVSPTSIASTHDAYATDVPITVQYTSETRGDHTANLVFTDAKGDVIKRVTLTGASQDAYYATAYAEARPNTSANIGQIFVTCNFSVPGGSTPWVASDKEDYSTNTKENGASTTTSANITAIYYAQELPGYKFAGWYSDEACTTKKGDGDAADRNKYTEIITTSATTEPYPTIRRYAKFDAVTVSNATDQTVTFTTSSTQTVTLTFPVTNADNNEDFNAPVVSGDAGWTMTSWTYANNNVTVTMSFTATEKTTTKGDHTATVTLTAKSSNSATGNVTAHVEMIPQYTCTIKDGYYVEEENNSLDLQNLWKSSSDGAITYEIMNFEAADGAQDGATAPAISDNRYLSLGQAGTLELKLTQAEGTSSVAGTDTKTVTITRNPNPVTVTINGVATKNANIWLDEAQPCVISTANTRTQDNIKVSQTAGSEYATYANDNLTSNYKLGTASFSVSQPQDYKYEAASDNFSATVAEGVYNCNNASLSANPTTLSFSKIKGEAAVSKTFALTYLNCNQQIKVINSNPDAFEITSTIAGSTTNKTENVTVTYKKLDEVRNDEATFTIYDHSHVITVTATGETKDIQDPVFTCNIADNYNVDAAAINLATLWTSNNKYADAPITYSINFTPDEGNHDGATGVTLAGNSLSFGDAGTVVITMHQAANAFYRERTETKEVKINRLANTVTIEIQDQVTTTRAKGTLLQLYLGDEGQYWLTPTHEAQPVSVEQIDNFKSCTIYPGENQGFVYAAATITEAGKPVTFKVTQPETYKYVAIDTAFYATVSEFTDEECNVITNAESVTFQYNTALVKEYDVMGENTGTLTYTLDVDYVTNNPSQYMGEYSVDGINWVTFQEWTTPSNGKQTKSVPTNISKIRFSAKQMDQYKVIITLTPRITISSISLPRAHYLRIGKNTGEMVEDDIKMNDGDNPQVMYLYDGGSINFEFDVAWSACHWANGVYLQCNRGGDAEFTPATLPYDEEHKTGTGHISVKYTPTHWGMDTVIVAVYNRSHRRRIFYYLDVKPYIFNGDGDWNNAANWEDGKMPANFTTADVLVAADATVNSDVAVKSIQLASGSSLTLDYGTKMTINQETNALHQQETNGDVIIMNDAKLKLQSGTFYAGNLTMQGGLYKNSEADAFGMPQLYIADAASLHTDAEQLNYEYSVDYTRYYPLALPFASSLSGLRYTSKPTASTASIIGEGNAIDICRYDGEERAKKNSSTSYNSQYWKSLSAADVLQPSTGYIITAKKLKGDTYATLRFPMAANNGYFTYGEQGSIDGKTFRNAVEIGAWNGYDGKDEKGKDVRWNNKGWNFVGNPFLSNKNGEDNPDMLRVQDSVGYWWEYKPNPGNVRYVTVPTPDMDDYVQTPITDAEIESFYPYFVQAKQSGFLLFDPSYRVAPNAPERRMMPAENEGMQEQEVYITIKNDNMHDMIGLIVADNYTNDYELNADLAKMLGDANTLRSYLTVNNMDLAFAAVDPETAKEMIPVTVRIPESGTYTWAVKGSSVTDQMDALYLTDFQEGKVVNLLEEDYTFTSSKAMLDDRFALNASFDKQDTPTDLQTNKNDKQMHKIIYKEHLYILRDGKVFDGQGKLIKRLLQ